MSDGGWFDFGNTEPDFSSTDPYGSGGISEVDVTPGLTLTDYSSVASGADDAASTGSWDDFLKAIPLIGSTFASTFATVNHPVSPTTGAPEPPSANAPASAAPSMFDHLLDFHSPYPYLIGGAVLLLIMMHKQNSGD